MKIKKMKKKYRWILVIPIIILMIYLFKILLAIYDYDYKYGYRFPERKFVDNKKNEPYSQNIPLHEMDFDVYSQYLHYAVAGLEYEYVIIHMIELPCDVDYYERKEDSVPVLTLKKGTEVCVYPDDNIVIYGYGMQCWPDYEEEWRYGCPFIMEDIPYVVSEHPMYYVKSSQLRKVAWAYYQANKEHFIGWSWDAPKRITEEIDLNLYLHGAFCPERWKHFSVWRQSRYEALNKIRRKIPL